MNRDCEHDIPLVKCDQCNAPELRKEILLLRARNVLLKTELEFHVAVHKVTIEQRNKAWADLDLLASKVAARLEQSGATASAFLIRDAFINKPKP